MNVFMTLNHYKKKQRELFFGLVALYHGHTRSYPQKYTRHFLNLNTNDKNFT